MLEVLNRDLLAKDSITSSQHEPSTQRITPVQLRSAALACQQKGDYDKAVVLYKAYLHANPTDASTWSNLGAALRKQKRYQLAVSCYQRGLELEPRNRALLSNLANALKDLHRLDEALALHQQVLEQKPDDIQALMNHACALRENAQFAEALAQLDLAKSIAKATHPDKIPGIEWERAQNLLYLGNYKAGWPAYEARWQTGELPVKSFNCPRWNNESLTNKTIVLHAEQGYGDTILAARFIPQIKALGATVILQSKPELHRLFKNVGADQLIAPDEDAEQNIKTKPGYHCPLMSLMGHLGVEPHTIPPPASLHVPSEAKQKFASLKAAHPDKLKIGIVWSGSLTFANNHNRSIPLQQLLPLTEIANTRFYSFQKGPRAKDLQALGADCVIQDLSKQLNDFADTAAAIECMDVIVMTDSSVAHLAASFNKPVINLLNKVPYWLYSLDDAKTPWYPSMLLCKQQTNGDWSGALEAAKRQLLFYLNPPIKKN